IANSSARYANGMTMTTQVSSTRPLRLVGPLDDQGHEGDQGAPGEKEVRVQHRDAGDGAVDVEDREHRIAEQHQTEQAQRRQPLASNVELLHVPSSAAAGNSGGESGIRTHGTLLTYTRFPSVRLKPLGHLSAARDSTFPGC